MPPAETRPPWTRRSTTALTLCLFILGVSPSGGRAEVAAAVDSGPAIAALRGILEDLRAAPAAGALSPELAAAAEELWLEQQADLIRTDAELQILSLRAEGACPTVEEVVELIAGRERRAFERLEQLRGLLRGLPDSPVAREDQELVGEEVAREEPEPRLRITSEPEDLTENPTP